MSTNQAISSAVINGDAASLDTSTSVIGETDVSVNGGGVLITQSQHGSNELVNVIDESTGSENGAQFDPNTLRPPEEMAANAQRLREQLRRSLSQGRGE